MIGLPELHLALPIVAAIIVCELASLAFLSFASLYFNLYRYAKRLAKRTMVQSGADQGFSELERSLPPLGLPELKSSSIIPTMGKAFVLDTTERMPTS